MNATEMGRRSDSLYYDNVSRRELCDRIAHLESDLEDAKAENARLRKLVQDMLDYGVDAGTGMFEWFFDRVRGLWRDKEEDDG